MIVSYQEEYQTALIRLILGIQNNEFHLGISLNEQPDLIQIKRHYLDIGGGFWLALNQEEQVIGTIALQKETEEIGILKKFFISEAYRGREFGISQKLYETLLDFAKKEKFVILLLDSPAEAKRSHAFYRKMGFQLIGKDALPISYTYPDRNSCIFSLKL